MTRGDWNQVWDSPSTWLRTGFDKRQTAKGAVAAANEDAAEGEDMFAWAGVAAE